MHTGRLQVATRGEAHVIDITAGVRHVIAQSGVADGVVTVFVTGSTAAVTTMEYEPGGVQDLTEAFERWIPRARAGEDYAHNRLNHDDNAHAHLRASLIGASETVPLVGGSLMLGVWQQLVLIDFDDRPRDRTVTVSIVS